MKFAFGLHPKEPNASALPAWEVVDDDYILNFTQPAGVSGITRVAEYSTSLTPASWTAFQTAGPRRITLTMLRPASRSGSSCGCE